MVSAWGKIDADHAGIKYSKFLFDLKKLGYCDEVEKEKNDLLDT